MSKRINEANAHGMRAVLNLLNEAASVDDEVSKEGEVEEVAEAAEMDQTNRAKDSKGQPYQPRADMPGKADIKMRNVGNYADNPLAVESMRSFKDYLQETEELNELSPELRDRYRRKAGHSKNNAQMVVDIINDDPDHYDPTGEHLPAHNKVVDKRNKGIERSFDAEPTPEQYKAEYQKETGTYNIVDTITGETVETNVSNSGGLALSAAARWNRSSSSK